MLQPFEHPYRSEERGEVWAKIAINLNDLRQPTFKVSKRSVRDRLTPLQSRFKEKIRMEEEGASGMDCEESELDQALEEITDKEKAAEAGRKENCGTQQENEKLAAEEQRKKAMERLGETQKRKGGVDEKVKKSRKSGPETLQYLREKMENEKELRKQEIEQKAKDHEVKLNYQKLMADQQSMPQQQHQDMLRLFQAQQQKQEQQIQSYQMTFLQQQQQQSQILMSLLDKVFHGPNNTS